MRRGWTLVAASALLFAVPAGRASGMCNPTSVDQIAGLAEIVFAGTVAATRVERFDGGIVTRYVFHEIVYVKGSGLVDSLVLISEGGTIGNITEFTPLEDTHFDRGRRYIVATGRWRRDPTGPLHPLSCGFSFLVEPDAGSGPAVVKCGHDRPVVAFRDRYLVIRDDRDWEPDPHYSRKDRAGRVIPQTPPDLSSWTWESRDTTKVRLLLAVAVKAAPSGSSRQIPVIEESIWRQRDPGTRVSEAEFLDRLRAIVREQAAATAEDTGAK